MGGDPIRRSGELRVEQSIAELISQAHDRLEKQIGTLDEKFDAHADKVNTRLAAGDTHMALMNQSIKSVQTEVTTMRGELRDQSDKVRNVQAKGDRTPRATPALEPKAEQAWLTKTLRKGAEAGIVLVCATMCLGVFLWFVRGNAAKLLDTSPAAAPTIPAPATSPGAP